MKTALLIVDIQNDYFPGGKMELVNSLQAAEQAARLLAHFRQQKWPIVHIQHLSTRPGATFFLPNTPGAEIHASVLPLAGEIVIQKQFPNSFRETLLLQHLHNQDLKRLLICGMMTHMCIDATTRAAADHGFTCLLAHDACATRALIFNDQAVPAIQVHTAFLAALRGTYAQVFSAQEALDLFAEEG